MVCVCFLLSLRAKRGNPDLFGIIIYGIAAVVTLPRNDKERIINRPSFRRRPVSIVHVYDYWIATHSIAMTRETNTSQRWYDVFYA